MRRHKIVLLVLGIYWPLIFWLTHIPVPDIARKSGMSDKTMHVLAYLALTYLVWFAVSPYHKVRWNKIKPWIVLVVVMLYGLADEYLQARVGRSSDVMDLVANLFGVVLGLGILSIFSFWSSMWVVAAGFIFVISNMSNLLNLPRFSAVPMSELFHLTAYAAFTSIWIQYWARRHGPDRQTFQKAASPIVPILFLCVVKLSALFLEQPLIWTDAVAALFGIVAAILVSRATIGRFYGKK